MVDSDDDHDIFFVAVDDDDDKDKDANKRTSIDVKLSDGFGKHNSPVKHHGKIYLPYGYEGYIYILSSNQFTWGGTAACCVCACYFADHIYKRGYPVVLDPSEIVLTMIKACEDWKKQVEIPGNSSLQTPLTTIKQSQYIRNNLQVEAENYGCVFNYPSQEGLHSDQYYKDNCIGGLLEFQEEISSCLKKNRNRPVVACFSTSGFVSLCLVFTRKECAVIDSHCVEYNRQHGAAIITFTSADALTQYLFHRFCERKPNHIPTHSPKPFDFYPLFENSQPVNPVEARYDAYFMKPIPNRNRVNTRVTFN